MKKIVPGAMAVILSPDRTEILLHLRDDNLLWSLPGGSAEYGESLPDLVLREVYEETGLSVSVIRVFGIYSSPTNYTFRYKDGNEVHSYVIGVECSILSGSEHPNSTDSLAVSWFKLDSLPSDIMENQVDVIYDCIHSKEVAMR